MKKSARHTQRAFTLVEILLALALSSIVTIAAIQLLVFSQARFNHMRAQSTLVHRTVAVSEMLRQAVWKAGQRSSSHAPAEPLRISGNAPTSHLHVGYALDSSGIFTAHNCAGNARNRGSAIQTTTDNWYARVTQTGTAEIYCKPGVGAGAVLEGNVSGINFQLLLADKPHMTADATTFFTQATQPDLYQRAVVTEITLAGDSQLSAQHPFLWTPFSVTHGRQTLSWKLVLPTSVEIQ